MKPLLTRSVANGYRRSFYHTGKRQWCGISIDYRHACAWVRHVRIEIEWKAFR
jgi:hypothetical protein